MKNLSLRTFEIVLLLFSISVTLTMYSMAAGEEEGQLWGLSYSFYLLPLLAVNLIICVSQIINGGIPFKGLITWIVIWSIIATLNAFFTASNNVIAVVRVNIWTSSFLAAYCLARTNRDVLNSLVKLFLVIFVIGFVVYWQGKITQSVVFSHGLETRSNAIYCIVTVIPILMLLKKKWIVFILMLVTFISTIFSSKRGAAIILLLTMIPIMRSSFSGIKSSFWKNFILVFMIAGLSYFLLYVSNSFLGGILVDRFSTIEETGGSNRSEMWGYVLNSFVDSNVFQQLFGHGYKAVSILIERAAAHNDFVEVLYDYGIIGLIVYIAIHFYLIKKCIWLWTKKNEFFLPFVTMYLTFFTMSMVSILIVQQRYLIYMAVFWGVLEGLRYNDKYISKNNNRGTFKLFS